MFFCRWLTFFNQRLSNFGEREHSTREALRKRFHHILKDILRAVLSSVSEIQSSTRASIVSCLNHFPQRIQNKSPIQACSEASLVILWILTITKKEKTMITILPMRLFAFVLLLTSSTHAQVSETIFDALVPSACVGTALLQAGACTLQRGCASRCFDRKTTDSKVDAPTQAPANVTASSFNLDSQGFSNFYIPVDAVECDQFEDPICPATTCCPACKNELNELYKCIILEGSHHYIYPLANFCPLDCKSNFGTGGGLVVTSPPTFPPTNPPVVDDVDLDERLDIDSNETDDFFDNETAIEELSDAEEDEPPKVIEISWIEDGVV